MVYICPGYIKKLLFIETIQTDPSDNIIPQTSGWLRGNFI